MTVLACDRGLSAAALLLDDELRITSEKQRDAYLTKLVERCPGVESVVDDLRQQLIAKSIEDRPSSRDASSGQGTGLGIEDPEPWDEEVDGDDLLHGIGTMVMRYVSLPDGAFETLALWTLYTHVHECFDVAPRLLLTSPSKRCGKSTLLRIISGMVARGLSSEGITASALFRVIEKARPTILLDEADTVLLGRNASEDLRGVIDSGHAQGGCLIRCVGDDHEPRSFSTFTPMVIAMIGYPKGTILDRSISIQMQRRGQGEYVEKLRMAKIKSQLTNLRRRCSRWAQDNAERLAEIEPVYLEELDDRAADNWQPLLAVADLVGGMWPDLIRIAAVELSKTRNDNDDASELLLADIRDFFTDPPAESLASEEIVNRLGRMEHRPWQEWKAGKPMTKAQLARQLKRYGIGPGPVRIASVQVRGYRLDQLEPVFARYLPLPTPQGVTVSRDHV